MFLHTGGDCKNVRVEDDVLGGESYGFSEDFPGPFANINTLFQCIGLAPLIEGHHDDCRTVAHDGAGLLNEWLLALFHADGIDHAFTLQAGEAGFEHIPA